VAADEVDDLASYFVETEQWRKVLADEVDIIFGAKESGKSAIYSTLLQREEKLFDRGEFLISAENPRGTPAFKDLAPDPPTGELEFVTPWKLYILSLVGSALVDWNAPLSSQSGLRGTSCGASSGRTRLRANSALLNLVANRLHRNRDVVVYCGLKPEEALDAEGQRKFFDYIVPGKADAVKNPYTFEWIIGRVRDGTQTVAPREVIHLLTEARDAQLKMLGREESEPPGSELIFRQPSGMHSRRCPWCVSNRLRMRSIPNCRTR